MQAEDLSRGTFLLYGRKLNLSRQNSLITANWTAIRTLAPDRFDAYIRTGDSDELDAVARYAWNIDVSKSLHSKLHVLEITFRNQLNNSLARLYGPTWFDNSRIMHPNELSKASDARKELLKRRKLDTPGRIVASLTFGYWTELYSKRYEPTARRTLRDVFPNYDSTMPLLRSNIAPLLSQARLLRNRISHFEHIAFDVDLPNHHAQISDLTRWMHPQMAELSDIGDNFKMVYGRTWKAYRSIVEELFAGREHTY